MRLSLFAILAFWCLFGCVRCALISSIGNSRLFTGTDLSPAHTGEQKQEIIPLQLSSKQVGRKLLALPLPPTCLVINNQCGCMPSFVSAIATSVYDAPYVASKAVDNSVSTAWSSSNPGYGHVWGLNLGSSKTFFGGVVVGMEGAGYRAKKFRVYGSNVNIMSSEDKMYALSQYATICFTSTSNDVQYEQYSMNCTGSYLYISLTTGDVDWFQLVEVKFYESTGIWGQVVFNNACVCSPGNVGVGNSCTPCPVGYYCPPGSNTPSACPVNSVSLPGSTLQTDCICNAGYYASYQSVSLLRTCGANSNSLCTASASSVHPDLGPPTVSYFASYAIDNDFNNIWVSYTKVNGYDWLRIDFGTSRNMTGLSVRPPTGFGARLAKYQVRVGDDTAFPGTNTLVYSSQSSSVDFDNITFIAYGRYVYISVSESVVGSAWMTIAEMDVFGPDLNNRICSQCPVGSYCTSTSNTPVLCPLNSVSVAGSISAFNCSCTNGYYGNASIADSLSREVNLLRTCGSGSSLCNVSASTTHPGDPGVSYPVSNVYDNSLLTSWFSYTKVNGYDWISVDYETPRNIKKIVISPDQTYTDRLKYFRIYVGNSSVFPGSNSLVYTSQSVSFLQETVNLNAYGRYVYVAVLESVVGGSRMAVSELNIYDVTPNIYACNCPKGKIISNGNCVACPIGMVCATSDSSLSCSSGSYCPSGSTVEQPCQAGYYCSTPSTQVQCPADTYCPLSSTAPISCDSGKVSQPGSSSITQCETSTIVVNFQIDGVNPTLSQSQFQNALPASISVSGYQESLISGQSVCPTGYYCPPDTTVPVPCPAGTYNNVTNQNGLEDCFACPVGQYCTINSTLPVQCAAGSYRITENATQQGDCTVCPSGNYCPIGSITPTNCSAGTYNPTTGGIDSSNCTSCPAGDYCPIATTTPIACQAGSYRGTIGGVDQGSCTTCPSGNYCPLGSIDPTNCSASTYRSSSGALASSDCISCPAGDYCPIATTTPIACQAGSYRGTTGGVDQGSCTICPTGNYCPIGSVDPTNCSAGTYNPATGQGSSASCLACPAGDYCPIATTTPSLCSANTFSANTGQAVCDQCPVFSTSPIASTNCTCDAGHYHVVVTTGGGSAAQSLSVSRVDTIYDDLYPNSYKYLQSGVSNFHVVVNKGSTATFTSSAYGATNTIVPLKVFNRLYNPNSYFISQIDKDSNWVGVQALDVIPRPASMIHATQTSYLYSLGVTGQGTSTLVWDTTDVPSNLYYVGAQMTQYDAPLSVFVASPTPVTITYSPYIALSVSLTAACLGDTLVLNKPTGQTIFSTLPYKDIYVSCISNTDANDPPAITVMASGPSPLTWMVSGIDNTKQCYVSYGPLPGDAWNGNVPYYSLILIYPRPTATATAVSTLTCANCSAGYRSDPGAKVCLECGLGYYSNPISQTCTACPAGTKCPTNTTSAPVDCGVGFYQSQSTQYTCLPCPSGKYCDSATTVTPTSCPAGTYRATEGASSLSDCLVCPVGKFCLIATTTPDSCAAGTYRSTTGAESQDQCSTCTTGHYCPISSVNPTDCAAGTYNGLTGQDEPTDCQNCTTGNYCPVASVSPTQCLAGTYNLLTGQDEATDCPACPTGQYCPIGTTNPTSCAAGSYRDTTGAQSQADCSTCTTGHYCPLSSTNPTDCPGGTYTGLTGQDELTDCQTCPVGQYCPIATTVPVACAAGSYRSTTGAAAQGDCTVCTTGNYCPIQSVNPTQCIAGTYNPNTGATNNSYCLVCAAGKYSLTLGRSTDCPNCAAGSFCVNSTTAQLCPDHTTSSAGSSSLLDCRCLEGFQCSYTKQITATVTLNTSFSSFTSDVGGVQTAFKQQVAAAAGVKPSQVIIKSVAPKVGGRRLLGHMPKEHQLIDVHMVVNGASSLRNLNHHLAAHIYKGHVWSEAHRVNSEPLTSQFRSVNEPKKPTLNRK